MKRAVLMLATLALLLGGVSQGNAVVIAGPTSFPIFGGNDTSWGIQFTGLQNVTLTAFDYYHRPADPFGNPFSGSIFLNDITSSITVFSTSYPAFSTTVLSFTGLGIPIQAGHTYQLVASSIVLFNTNDEVYQYVVSDIPPFSYPVVNSQISVTQGVFDQNPGFQESFGWASFKNITTIPEPSALFLLVTGLVGLLGYGWRRQRRSA